MYISILLSCTITFCEGAFVRFLRSLAFIQPFSIKCSEMMTYFAFSVCSREIMIHSKVRREEIDGVSYYNMYLETSGSGNDIPLLSSVGNSNQDMYANYYYYYFVQVQLQQFFNYRL